MLRSTGQILGTKESTTLLTWLGGTLTLIESTNSMENSLSSPHIELVTTSFWAFGHHHSLLQQWTAMILIPGQIIVCIKQWTGLSTINIYWVLTVCQMLLCLWQPRKAASSLYPCFYSRRKEHQKKPHSVDKGRQWGDAAFGELTNCTRRALEPQHHSRSQKKVCSVSNSAWQLCKLHLFNPNL